MYVLSETILDDISFADDDDAVQCIGDQSTFNQMVNQNKLIGELQFKVGGIFEAGFRIFIV